MSYSSLLRNGGMPCLRPSATLAVAVWLWLPWGGAMVATLRLRRLSNTSSAGIGKAVGSVDVPIARFRPFGACFRHIPVRFPFGPAALRREKSADADFLHKLRANLPNDDSQVKGSPSRTLP
jgi:hypothetical protein